MRSGARSDRRARGTPRAASSSDRGRASPAPRLGGAGHRELVLRVANPLLELPAVRLGLSSLDPLQLRLRLLELLPCPARVDLQRADGVVDERERAVLLDLEEARPGRELLD